LRSVDIAFPPHLIEIYLKPPPSLIPIAKGRNTP
jgi:hypothetical protein